MSPKYFWTPKYSENLLKTAPGGSTLDYDPLGRLYQTTGAGVTTRFGYDGGDMIAEYNASNALQRRYVHGPGIDEPVLWYEGSDTADKRYLMADERGSIVSVTSAGGDSIAINRYDEYGVAGAGNSGRFQYTGQAWLPEIGLSYYKARIYNPALGRFMQTDPIGYADGMNWYNYVGSDPVNFVDPSGLALQLHRLPHVDGGGKSADDEPGDEEILVIGQLPKTPNGRSSSSPFDDPNRNLQPRYRRAKQQNDDIVVTGKKYPHYYYITDVAFCSPSALFNTFRQPGRSAPDSPYAKDDTTQDIGLSGSNPITQVVSPSTMTIVNITQEGHYFHSGTVTIQISPSIVGSRYEITGRGYNGNYILDLAT